MVIKCRIKNLKNTPVYVKPQFSSSDGTCRVNVVVGLRNDPGKPIDCMTVEFPLPPSVTTWDLTANHGTVYNLSNSKVRRISFGYGFFHSLVKAYGYNVVKAFQLQSS